jgi:transcriptional regulator with XRE-family HTH domain
VFAFNPAALIDARTGFPLSREQLAVAAHCSHNSIVAYENALREPSGRILLAIAAALDIDPRELYEEIEPAEAVVR